MGFCARSVTNTPSHPHVLKSIISLFSQGRTRFEEIDMVRKDTFFKNSFDLKYVPAKETVRRY
ncbi:MAG: hypothetical protein PF447_12550 [Spirochaetaceae bacterium]|nr:hypothetical protein [Spirochaetaceae bacterium]